MFASIELTVVVVYLGLMIAVGVVLARRNRGGLDFFAGGRAIPWWVSGISLYMGNFSAWLFTGGAGLIYRTTGYGLLYFLLTGSVAYLLGSRLTAARWRRSRVISPVEFTRRRFGVVTQQVLGIITSIVFIAAAGNQLKAIATVVESIVGVPIAAAAAGIGTIVILYTLAGGLWAVMVTDVLQFVVLLGVTLLIAPLAVMLVDGGLHGVWHAVAFAVPPADGKPGEDLHLLIGSLLLFTIGVGGGQGPRFYCVPNERDARKVGALAAALFLTTPVLFSLPPLAARALWGGPAALARHIPGPNPHEQVFVHIAREVLPPGLVGVFLAAMFAATMSALDSVYNMVASVLSRDVFMHFRPGTSNRGLMIVGRIMTLAIGLMTIGLCLAYIAGERDLFTIMLDIVALSAPVMNVPMLMGLLFRRAPRAAGLFCILWGTATAIVTRFALGWTTGPQIYLTEAVCFLAFAISPGLGRLGRRRLAPGVLAAGLGAGLFAVTAAGTPGVLSRGLLAGQTAIIGLYALFMAAVFVALARTLRRPEDRTEVDAFHRTLDTPVDVAAEVKGSAGAALAVYRLVGGLTLAIAGLVLLLMAAELASPPPTGAEPVKYLALAGILVVLAALFGLPGLRGWRR